MTIREGSISNESRDLERIVREHDREVRALRNEVQRLKQRIADLVSTANAKDFERPPHYL